jgi:segregation and condensation protein B
MDEISRDPLPEPLNEEPTLRASRRLVPLEEPDLDEPSLDAPPAHARLHDDDSRYTLEQGSADGGPMTPGPGSDPETSPGSDADPLDDAPGAGSRRDEGEEEETTLGEGALPPELADVPALTEPAQLRRTLLAALLASRETLSFLRLAQVCNITQKVVEETLLQLRDELSHGMLPVELAIVGQSARLLTTPDVFPYLQRLRAIKKAERLSPAAIETLAVIAYRQPVIRAEIEGIRGVKAGPMLRTLLDHKLIRIKGRRDVPGRPLEYETTPQFLERFGIGSLQDLPSLREFKAI